MSSDRVRFPRARPAFGRSFRIEKTATSTSSDEDDILIPSRESHARVENVLYELASIPRPRSSAFPIRARERSGVVTRAPCLTDLAGVLPTARAIETSWCPSRRVPHRLPKTSSARSTGDFGRVLWRLIAAHLALWPSRWHSSPAAERTHRGIIRHQVRVLRRRGVVLGPPLDRQQLNGRAVRSAGTERVPPLMRRRIRPRQHRV